MSVGLTSSNDGSTLALARAIGLHGQTSIDKDVGLTLGVDRAFYNGHHYSDRPPGTAFLAIPAVIVGDRWDPILLEFSRRREAVLFSSAGSNYSATYVSRFSTARPLWTFQGTSVAIRIHSIVLSLIGLFFLGRACRTLQLSEAAVLFSISVLGGATLWGVYSGMLFGHITVAAAISVMLWGLSKARSGMMTTTINLVLGMAAGWAMISDFLTVLAVVPLVLLLLSRKFWPLSIVGASMVILPSMLYHYQAFGSPLSIGYDHHANFDFARGRSTNFGGSFVQGLWCLIGWGKDAGVLAQSPILVLGVVGAITATKKFFQPTRKMVSLALLSFVCWFALLCMHQTPYGGGTSDHRYLIPIFPVLGMGLALFWEQWLSSPKHPKALYGGVGILYGLSAYWTWSHFLLWRG